MRTLRAPTPFLGESVALGAIGTSAAPALLSAREIAEANAGMGLHAVTIALGWTPARIPQEYQMPFRQWGLRSFREAHDGYKLRQIVSECFRGAEEDIFLGAGAWTLRRRFEAADDVPIVVTRTKEEAEAVFRTSQMTSDLFVWRSPRYGFSREQQRFLLLAMELPTDRELAAALAITDHAIGRRWSRIFKRVEILQPKEDPIFPQECSVAGRRSRLLSRLTSEMHELRPFRRAASRDGAPSCTVAVASTPR